jgi:hypothetical protein
MRILSIVLSLWITSSVARADDVCVEYTCTGNALPNGKITFYGMEVTNFQKTVGLASVTCSCSRNLHVATADEIGSAISRQIRDAVTDAIARGTSDALQKINDDNAKREQKLLDKIAELERENQKQIQLLTAILQGKPVPVSPPPANPPATGTHH